MTDTEEENNESNYIPGVADKIIELRTLPPGPSGKPRAKTDPSFLEIARFVWKMNVPADAIERLRKDAPMIIACIRRREPDCLVHTVGDGYYTLKMRGRNPDNIEEAKLALPIGRGGRRAGIRFASGEEDLLWQLMNQHHTKSAIPSSRNALRRKVLAVDAGALKKSQAKAEVREALLLVPPDNISRLGDLNNGNNLKRKIGRKELPDSDNPAA